MGKVFTWNAIHKKRIPKLIDFELAARMFGFAFASTPSIKGAIIFGSAVRGDATVRSDIDCAVLYEISHEKDALDTLRGLDTFAAGLFIPVNFVACDTMLADTRFHNLGPSFIKHLEMAAEVDGVAKGDMLGELKPTIPIRDEIESYLVRKMGRMQESLAKMDAATESELCATFQKVLEAPLHIGRKMLSLEGKLFDDSKIGVKKQYQDSMPEELVKDFERLLALDTWYTEELEVQLKVANRDRYDLVINKLRSEAPKMLRFLRSNLIYLDQSC